MPGMKWPLDKSISGKIIAASARALFAVPRLQDSKHPVLCAYDFLERAGV
jgi:hypothetical protein